MTTVNDFAGNQRVWNHTAGSKVPTSLVASSNRDVRATAPSTWTTSFAHNTNLLLTKVVHPAANRTDCDWNSSYCLTEIRKKETNTDTDDNDDDLVWTNVHHAARTTFTCGPEGKKRSAESGSCCQVAMRERCSRQREECHNMPQQVCLSGSPGALQGNTCADFPVVVTSFQCAVRIARDTRWQWVSEVRTSGFPS